MLTRWAAFAPGTRMPDSIEELEFLQQVALQTADADLYALLANQAPAELELAAMNGSLAAVAPTQQELQYAAKASRIAELVEMSPYGIPGRYEGEQFIPAQPGNVTLQFELESLDPTLAAQLRTQATPPAAPQGLSAADAAWVNNETLRLRYAAQQQPTPAGA